MGETLTYYAFPSTTGAVRRTIRWSGSSGRSADGRESSEPSPTAVGADVGCGETPAHRFHQMGHAALHGHGPLLNPAKQEAAA